MSRRIEIVSDAEGVALEGARLFAETVERSVSNGHRIRVALSGGNTPRAMFARLTGPPFRESIDWTRLDVYFSDERWVPPDSPESNYHMARETLLSRVSISEPAVHPVPTVGISPEEAAARYEREIRTNFGIQGSDIPAFDLILLGMGTDGHTASLFPDSSALEVTDALVAANFVPKLDAWRITFTYPLINAARHVLFLAEGANKASILSGVLQPDSNLPAARVRPQQGDLTWLIDRAAAASLPAALKGPA